MSPQEALNLLDQAAMQINASREVHAKLQEAVVALNELINPTPAVQEKPPKSGLSDR